MYRFKDFNLYSLPQYSLHKVNLKVVQSRITCFNAKINDFNRTVLSVLETTAFIAKKILLYF